MECGGSRSSCEAGWSVEDLAPRLKLGGVWRISLPICSWVECGGSHSPSEAAWVEGGGSRSSCEAGWSVEDLACSPSEAGWRVEDLAPHVKLGGVWRISLLV